MPVCISVSVTDAPGDCVASGVSHDSDHRAVEDLGNEDGLAMRMVRSKRPLNATRFIEALLKGS